MKRRSGKRSSNVGVRRWRALVIGTNGEILFDRPKPTAGCSANGRRRSYREQYFIFDFKLSPCSECCMLSSG
jgi:hypothetical protein